MDDEDDVDDDEVITDMLLEQSPPTDKVDIYRQKQLIGTRYIIHDFAESRQLKNGEVPVMITSSDVIDLVVGEPVSWAKRGLRPLKKRHVSLGVRYVRIFNGRHLFGRTRRH